MFTSVDWLMLFCSGVGDQTENLIFPAIIDRNAAGFFNCYKKGDELFKRLAEELNKFKVRLYRTEQTKKFNLRKYCSTITNSISRAWCKTIVTSYIK